MHSQNVFAINDRFYTFVLLILLSNITKTLSKTSSKVFLDIKMKPLKVHLHYTQFLVRLGYNWYARTKSISAWSTYLRSPNTEKFGTRPISIRAVPKIERSENWT